MRKSAVIIENLGKQDSGLYECLSNRSFDDGQQHTSRRQIELVSGTT